MATDGPSVPTPPPPLPRHPPVLGPASILSSRLGYEKDAPGPVPLVCADDSEKAYLVEMQRKYRRAPDRALATLQQAEEQIAGLKPFNHAEQEEFVLLARQRLQAIGTALDRTATAEQGPAATVADAQPPPPRRRKLHDARNGAILQCIEAASLGMPLEVWKTRMGRHRNETTLQALRGVYIKGGGGLGGVGAFWAGTSAKMVESASKGAVLMFSKEFIKDNMISAGFSPTTSGFAAGAGGGICQVSVMGPCTYLVTSVVNGQPGVSLVEQMRTTWQSRGLAGFYPGGTAIAFRQATNWASRQGFTDAVREGFKRRLGVDTLTIRQEVLAGIIGGALACWNHPFEVARIEAQSRAVANEPALSMLAIFRLVVKEHGMAGLFKGVIPRIGLGIWQTTFMVTGANLIREKLFNEPAKYSKH